VPSHLDKAGSNAALRREVGLVGATISGTGVIIGAGIYALIGEGAETAGNAVWMAFLAAAIVAGLSGITYSRMGRRVPKDSPEFQYAGHGLGFRAGFLAGWLMLWADMVAAAAVALAFGGYFASLFGGPLIVAGLVLVFLLALVVSAGIHESIILISVLTAAEVLGLLIVSLIGIPHWGEEPLLQMNDGLSGVWAASSLIFFAYIGFDELGNLAEEMRQPERDLPRAIVLAMALSTLLYVLVSVSAVSLIGAEALGGSSAPLADAVARAIGGAGRTGLSVLALAATSNTVLLLMLSGSRSLFGMARSGALPPILGRLSAKRTPIVGVAVVVLVISSFVLLGDIGVVAKIATFSTLVSFSLVNVSLVSVLKREAGGWFGAAKRPIGLLQPILGAAACGWLAIDVGWTAAAAGGALGFLGLCLGILIEGRRRRQDVDPNLSTSRHLAK
jgi:APA family basic amino acid/polyamine antiporter